MGSRFLGKVAPVASYIGRVAPQAIGAANQFVSNPLVNQIANKIGVSPATMRNVATGVSNVQSGISLVPGIYNQSKAAVSGAMQAAAPARQSMAELYRTLNPS
jgi:hypothetical protein